MIPPLGARTDSLGGRRCAGFSIATVPLVEIAQARDEIFYASRLDPEHPWVQWTVSSMTTT